VIIIAGARVGRILEVKLHPVAERIWLATVDIGGGKVQIVFGGKYKLRAGELVPAAPPGARAQVRPSDPPRIKKMRVRTYRGERSHGMLCSLDELGWTLGGPDEVAVLRGLEPGDCLHSLSVDQRAGHVERPDSLQLADVDDAALPAQDGQIATK
jgi:tRNA-binding EMAP/Myf-like protein